MYKERINACYSRTFDVNQLPNGLGEVLVNEAGHRSLNPEYLLIPLFTSTCHLKESEIQPWSRWIQNSSLFGSVIGFTGTGKTTALNLFKNALINIEDINGVTMEDSRLDSSATVESLLRHLNKTNSIIQLWDEIKTWSGSLGLYKSGGIDYDTSIYLSAYNGDTLKRQTSNSVYLIRKPYLNLCALSHPGFICKKLDEEYKNAESNDGLFSRFLLNCPKPVFSSPGDRGCDINYEIPSIERVLYVVDKIGKRHYSVVDESLRMAQDNFRKQQDFMSQCHATKAFEAGVVSKLKGITFRLAMTVQVIDDALQILKDLGGNYNVYKGLDDQAFVDGIKKHINEQNNYATKISEINMATAIALADYFQQHHLNLAGIGLPNAKTKIAVEIPNQNLIICKKILLHSGYEVKCSDIARQCHFKAEDVKYNMENLSTIKFGRSMLRVPSTGGRPTLVFMKRNTDGMDANELQGLLQEFVKLGITLDEYENSFGLRSKENVS